MGEIAFYNGHLGPGLLNNHHVHGSAIGGLGFRGQVLRLSTSSLGIRVLRIRTRFRV